MRRRNFISMATLASIAGIAPRAAGSTSTSADPMLDGTPAKPDSDWVSGLEGVDPYFLDSGRVPDDEQRKIQDYEAYLDVQQRGGEAIQPRGGRPRWSPTYRLLHWPGEPGQADVSLQGPLSLKPQLPDAGAYQLNAQVLDFHTAAKRWGGGAQGTLTVEFRARQGGEALTWLFAEQFNCFGHSTSLGNGYVAERNNLPEPVVLDEGNVDIRVQLMRQRKSPGVLRKILNIASFIVGGGATGVVRELVPSVRIPQLVEEGVALTQALFGEMSDEKPQWLSGFNSYGLNEAGSRMTLAPGFWVVLDEVIRENLEDLVLEEQGDRVVLTVDGEPIDATYLVFWVDVAAGNLRGGRGVIRKGA